MKDFKESDFLPSVSSIYWEEIFQWTDASNKLVNDWPTLFSLVIEKHAPLWEMSVSEKYCSWIDKDRKCLMLTRDRLKKAALKSKSPILMNSYRHARNGVNSLNIQLKRQYFTRRMSECKENMKKSWKMINELSNKRSKTCNIDFSKILITQLSTKRRFQIQ